MNHYCLILFHFYRYIMIKSSFTCALAVHHLDSLLVSRLNPSVLSSHLPVDQCSPSMRLVKSLITPMTSNATGSLRDG